MYSCQRISALIVKMRIKQIVFVEAMGYLLVLTHGISSLKSSQLGYLKGNANRVW